MIQNDEIIPKVEKSSPIDEDVQYKYDNMLRHHFLYGSKISRNAPKHLFPILSAFQTGSPMESTYPIIYDPIALNVQSFNSVVVDMVGEIFNEVEKETLVQVIPAALEQFHERLLGQNMVNGCEFQINEFVSGLRDQINLIENKDDFHKHCDELKLRLLNYSKDIIGFSGHTVFQFINLNLIKRRTHNIKFLEMLNKHISGLQELLRLHEKGKDGTNTQMDFASNLISFDEVDKMGIPAVSSGLPDSRLHRLEKSLKILKEAKESYSNNATTIFASEEMNKEYAIEETCSNTVLEVASNGVCKKARQVYESEISKFVDFIKALRIAELEINQQYDDNYHNTYFDNFELSFLSEKDYQYFRTVIILEKSHNLVSNSNDLLALLSDNALIKVLSINDVREISAFENKQQSEAFQELVSMALFKRNTNIYQGGTEDAQWLNEAITKGLEVSEPVLWNFILNDPKSNTINKDFSTIKTAIDSRFFPRFTYHLTPNQSFGDRINLKHNPQPDAPFAPYQKDIESLNGKTSEAYKLTMADFLAMNEDNLPMLEILPAGYENDALLVLDEYLSLPHDDLSHKIPFIWLMDEKLILKRAAVPMSWISRCRTSLDFWNFLQELSGMSHKDLTLEIEKVKSEWDAQKNGEIEALNAELTSKFELTRRNDLEKGIKRMLIALADGKFEIPKLTNNIQSAQENNIAQSTPVVQSQSIVQDNTVMETEKVESDPVLISIRPEAWVDVDECTTCNDCIDALPTVFKYNSDKQAYVHNPKGGSYLKIVSAAEKCPAACIHPGLPHDSSEKGLEKLIKRAEKFN